VVSRTTLRRAIPSFIVEVRRRPRLPTPSSPNVQSSETKPSRSAFDRESHRTAAAAFEAKNVDQPPVDVAASYRTGRILPSLVADEPLGRLLRDASLSAGESEPTSMPVKRQSARPLKGSAQTSKPPRNSGSSSVQSMPLADRLAAASRSLSGARSEEGIGVSASALTTAPSQVVGTSGGPALRAKAKRRDKMPISPDDGRATPLLNDQRSTITASPAMPPSSADERSRQSRKRTIIRHTFGGELKPGERWKRRLLYAPRRRRAD
jgi:hypothetical protein